MIKTVADMIELMHEYWGADDEVHKDLDRILELHNQEVELVREDAIDEYMNKLCDRCIQTPNVCRNLECPFADDECQIVKIAEQLKEQNNDI